MVVSWVLKLLSMSRKVEVYLLSLVICIIPGDVAVRRSEQFQQASEEQDARYHAFQPLLPLQI